jgi:two-component system NarL family response regulator
MKMKLLLIDNYEVFRKGLANLLESEPNIDVVSTSSTASEVIETIKQNKPDILLIDPELFESIDLIPRIQRVVPKARIIVLTHSNASAHLLSTMSGGAAGYILKDTKYESLLKVITLVAEGKLVIDQSMARLVADVFKFIHDHTHIMIKPEQVSSLTEQEKAILALLAKGATNKEIASSLCVTDNTVKVHIRNIMRKLHARNRLEAAICAIQAGLVHGIYEARGKDSTYNFVEELCESGVNEEA